MGHKRSLDTESYELGKKDARVDAYIAGSAEFAQLILRHLRAVVHRACPAVEETIKRKFPHFVYIEWITEAKQEATREQRLATMLEWLAEGKTRNRKYER